MDRLHRHTGADFALVAADGDTVDSSTAGFPQEILRSLAPLLARMSGGQLAAAATQADGWNVRCEVLGVHDSRPVLVAAARSVPSPEAVALISHTGSVITLLRRATDGDRTWRGFQYKARRVRFGVLSALLVAGPVPARRMTTGAVPPLLEADRLRVHLLHCLPADRDRIVRAYQDPSGYHGPDLLVHCPIFKGHVICLIADDTGGRKGDGSGGHPGGLGEELRRLVRDNAGYAMGVSNSHPLSSTAEAYGQAAHALAAARATPGRVVSHQEQTPLGEVLPRRPALAWARALLRPLDSLPKTTVDITCLVTSMPRAAVARLLDLSRNTVRAHLRAAEAHLRRDLLTAGTGVHDVVHALHIAGQNPRNSTCPSDPSITTAGPS
ncbi:hypothetical protein [Streptomyces aculeolatus]|uniref:hypothetical protein n=1 Tax=Streptomyces aculeolatus TaxID=270689 RepID=UPI001CECC515|nr:hypothetical protein [Streptomyces aculeolatus]